MHRATLRPSRLAACSLVAGSLLLAGCGGGKDDQSGRVPTPTTQSTPAPAPAPEPEPTPVAPPMTTPEPAQSARPAEPAPAPAKSVRDVVLAYEEAFMNGWPQQCDYVTAAYAKEAVRGANLTLGTKVTTCKQAIQAQMDAEPDSVPPSLADIGQTKNSIRAGRIETQGNKQVLYFEFTNTLDNGKVEYTGAYDTLVQEGGQWKITQAPGFTGKDRTEDIGG